MVQLPPFPAGSPEPQIKVTCPKLYNMLLVNSSPAPFPLHHKIQLSSTMREKMQGDEKKHCIEEDEFVYMVSTNIWHIGDWHTWFILKPPPFLKLANSLNAWIILMGHFVPVFHKPWELFWIDTVGLRLLWNGNGAFTGNIQETGIVDLVVEWWALTSSSKFYHAAQVVFYQETGKLH